MLGLRSLPVLCGIALVGCVSPAPSTSGVDKGDAPCPAPIPTSYDESDSEVLDRYFRFAHDISVQGLEPLTVADILTQYYFERDAEEDILYSAYRELGEDPSEQTFVLELTLGMLLGDECGGETRTLRMIVSDETRGLPMSATLQYQGLGDE